MSGKGGMDGGWFFPVETTLELAIKSSDEGPACVQFERWASSKNIDTIASVGRDMGAAPPRQTEVKFAIPGGSFFRIPSTHTFISISPNLASFL